MSELHVHKRKILTLLSEKEADFLIPDYQRPYAWDEDDCQTLWDDLHSFSFPDDNSENFKDNEEYFLGSIVTCKNEEGQSEVIDGQQRLTTLMLLLRAFYDKFTNMGDSKSKETLEQIEKCIWKTDQLFKVDKSKLKIDSEVATDDDKNEFLDILRTGQAPPNSKSQYAINYKSFIEKIEKFVSEQPSYYALLPARILRNCIVFPIEADSQNTALRIFSTLNDRGLPLSDADIFKAQLYKHFDDLGQKSNFIMNWKELEEITSQIFGSDSGMDELFTRYMYYLRAIEKNRSTTAEALRRFYAGKDEKYKYLKQKNTLNDLKALALFWKNVSCQDENKLSDKILKKLFILKNAPNRMWHHIVSVYFLQNRNESGELEETEFIKFLDKITAFILAITIFDPGVNRLRTPIYDEMINIIDGKAVTFSKYKFIEAKARRYFQDYTFTNQRNITRSILAWYAFTFDQQELLSLNEKFHIEHIYSKNRQAKEKGLQDESSLESLGNKALLEESINIPASDYHFEDKKKFYLGEMRKSKAPSKIFEVAKKIVHYDDFKELEIKGREKDILDKFFDFLREEELLTNDESTTSEESSTSGDLLTVGSN